MESSTNELLRKILSRLDRIEEKQDKQQRGQSDLSEEIQSVKTAVLSQGEKIHSRLQQLSGLTSTSAGYQGQLEGNETSEQPMEQLRQLFQEEHQSLQDKVQEAQNNTLDKIRGIHEEGKKMANFQGTLNDKVAVIEDKLDILGKQLEDKMKENTAIIKAHVSDVNKEMSTKMAETATNLLQENREKLTKLKGDSPKSTTASTSQMSDVMRKAVDEMTTNTREAIIEMTSVQTKTTTDLVQQCTQTVEGNIENSRKELTASLNRTKLEMFWFVEKECQLMKDVLEPGVDVPARRNYICDFFLENFKALIKSGERVHSYPWHIHQLRTCVQGNATFLTSGDLKIWLLYGRHPREVGLPIRSGVGLKISASVVDTKGKIKSYPVGEAPLTGNEGRITSNGDWGSQIGIINCQKLVDLGFGNKESYDRDAILIRFDIDVV